MHTLEFYKKQSLITDPKKFGYLFKSLPCDIAMIKSLLQGLILHFWDGNFYNYQIPLKRLSDIDLRYVEKMLEKIIRLDNAELIKARSLDRRMVGSCRDYATLFCAILRYHGIPARTRVAFSAFYFKQYYHDEMILEYWNQAKQRWCLVDTRVTDAHIKRQKLAINFDLLDVPRDQLIIPGLAWQMLREDPLRANKFCGGDKIKNKGIWYVRDRLIQDFVALNNIEMQLWDVWGLMFADQAIENDEEQLQFLDHLAELTIAPDKHFQSIRALYQRDARIKVPQKIKSFSPVSVCRRQDITLAFCAQKSSSNGE